MYCGDVVALPHDGPNSPQVAGTPASLRLPGVLHDRVRSHLWQLEPSGESWLSIKPVPDASLVAAGPYVTSIFHRVPLGSTVLSPIVFLSPCGV